MNPWEKDWSQEQPSQGGQPSQGSQPWEQDWGQKPAQPSKAYQGSILPFSVDEQGKAHFDSDAGIIGSIKRAVTLPRDWMDGKIDPNSDEAIKRTLEAASVMTPVNPAIRAGDAAIPGAIRAVRPERQPVPTREALRNTARGQYDAVRDAGVDYAGRSIDDLSRGVQQALQHDGILDVNAPNTYQILARLQNPPPGAVVEIQHLEAARRALGRIAQQATGPNGNGGEVAAALRAIDDISRFIERADPASVVAGPAADAGRAMGLARGNYAAYKRSDLLHNKEYAADLNAAAANSGQNIGNSIRQRLASVLKSEKQIRGYSPEEVAAIEGVVHGSVPANATRYASHLLGGGGGLGMALTGAGGAAIGAGAAGPAGAAIGGALAPVAGAGLKMTSNALTRRALRRADEMVRMRSPLYQDAVRNAPMTPISPARRAAALRAILLEQQQLPEE